MPSRRASRAHRTAADRAGVARAARELFAQIRARVTLHPDLGAELARRRPGGARRRRTRCGSC